MVCGLSWLWFIAGKLAKDEEESYQCACDQEYLLLQSWASENCLTLRQGIEASVTRYKKKMFYPRSQNWVSTYYGNLIFSGIVLRKPKGDNFFGLGTMSGPRISCTVCPMNSSSLSYFPVHENVHVLCTSRAVNSKQNFLFRIFISGSWHWLIDAQGTRQYFVQNVIVNASIGLYCISEQCQIFYLKKM